MKNENIIINIPQHSEPEKFMDGKRWNGSQWERFEKPTFDEIATKFPEIVEPQGGILRWGYAHYVKGADGMPKLLADCFDTSG